MVDEANYRGFELGANHMVEGFLNLCKNGFEKEAVEASCLIVLFCVLFCIVLGFFCENEAS